MPGGKRDFLQNQRREGVMREGQRGGGESLSAPEKGWGVLDVKNIGR